MKLDTFVEEGPSSPPRLQLESFRALMFALIISKNEIDVDLLLMIKDEVSFLFHSTHVHIGSRLTLLLHHRVSLPNRSFLCTTAPIMHCSW